MLDFLHGVEVVEVDTGPRPIRTSRASVIGLIGTAPQADGDAFPYHTPVLIAGRLSEAAGLGSLGTLPAAIDDIFDQTGAWVVVVRVPDFGLDDDLDVDLDLGDDGSVGFDGIVTGVPSPIAGSVDDDTGQYEGVFAFLGAESELGVTPRIIIAPEFSHLPWHTQELITVAERLRAIVIADGPNETDEAAINFRNQFGSDRLFIVDPWVKVMDAENGEEIIRPASARVAGVMSKVDAENGFWWSPSNKELRGVIGTARPVDFVLGDPLARANRLNELEIATIILKNGFRLWGNRTCSADPKWSFLSVRRTADIIQDSVLRAHLWAVDRNITRTYIEDLLEGVNAYLRDLKTIGAIINGQAWADPERNTSSQIADGKITIDFDFTPHYPAERITFRSQLVNDYLTEIIPTN